jgi:hypothetical protein
MGGHCEPTASMAKKKPRRRQTARGRHLHVVNCPSRAIQHLYYIFFIGNRNGRAAEIREISRSADEIRGASVGQRDSLHALPACLNRLVRKCCDQSASLFQVFGADQRDITFFFLPSDGELAVALDEAHILAAAVGMNCWTIAK